MIKPQLRLVVDQNIKRSTPVHPQLIVIHGHRQKDNIGVELLDFRETAKTRPCVYAQDRFTTFSIWIALVLNVLFFLYTIKVIFNLFGFK